MNREQYVEYVEKSLSGVLRESRFDNQKKQLLAIRLDAVFNANYSEDYLWNHSLFLSTNACVLLQLNGDKKLAIRSLKTAAEVFEALGLTSESYDKIFCLILSSLCYDISGYQASAYCLLKDTESYLLETIGETDNNLTRDNYIISQTIHILLKKIPLARQLLAEQVSDSNGLILFNSAIDKWFEVILNGTDLAYMEEIGEVYRYFLQEQNVYISQLLFLLRERIRTFEERSFWDNIFSREVILQNQTWKKYLKLLANDIYSGSNIKPIDRRISRFEFWTSQLRAIEGGLIEEDNNFIVQMPTSAGKTFIAELSILNALLKYPGQRCIYIAPFRALTNEKETDLAEYLSKLGYSVSALSGSYEIDEFEDIVLDTTDVLVATPEKMDLLLRLNPNYFLDVALMVVDEGHIIGDISPRASLLEFLIIRLRMKVPGLRTLFISAVMPPENANEYSIWLNGQPDKVLRSRLHRDETAEEWEPTRKLIGRFDWMGSSGRITYLNMDTVNDETRISTPAFVPGILRLNQYQGFRLDNKAKTTAALAYRLSANGNTYVYISQVRWIEGVARNLLKVIALEEAYKDFPLYFRRSKDKESYHFSAIWYGEESYITLCIERGIGIHFGDMPEPVRRAVENDYSNGVLRVLLATNTVGQGINFPIKVAIIHSTILTSSEDRPKYLSVRDFWNLIGRAGRAGKETEGQVVFVVNSNADKRAFGRFTNKGNIEEAHSILYLVLTALVNGRINQRTFERHLNTLAEPYILSLLAEEAAEQDEQVIIERMIDNSLFKVQADISGIDTAPLNQYFRATFERIRDEVNAEELRIFGMTGLNLESNTLILKFIEDNKGELEGYVDSGNYEGILELIFEVFDMELDEFDSYKLNRTEIKPSQTLPLALHWIAGSESAVLREEWSKLSNDPNGLFVLLADCYYYRYCWGISSFLTIMSHVLQIELTDLPENVKHLSSYLKFGVDNPNACLARSIGIKNRETALLLSNRQLGISGRDFLKWMANLEMEDIVAYETTPYESQNILETVAKLNPERQRTELNDIEFEVKGINHERSRRDLFFIVDIGDELEYERDSSNQYDPFAIQILKDGVQLGFVPREFAKIIAVDIDLNQAAYEITVEDYISGVDYDRIFARMVRI
ncbi:Helicase conserved C-terminal domain-containing protein [bacterium A37T11]|nr:Helicase conserved C-terminal domain-containing protein [bacterium A37T11]